MQIFCSAVALITALAVLIEIRKGPRFVSLALMAIITVSVALLVVDAGLLLNWWNDHWTHPIGTFFYCMF